MGSSKKSRVIMYVLEWLRKASVLILGPHSAGHCTQVSLSLCTAKWKAARIVGPLIDTTFCLYLDQNQKFPNVPYVTHANSDCAGCWTNFPGTWYQHIYTVLLYLYPFNKRGTGDLFTDSFAVKYKWGYTTTTIRMPSWSTPKQLLHLLSVSSSFLVRP